MAINIAKAMEMLELESSVPRNDNPKNEKMKGFKTPLRSLLLKARTVSVRDFFAMIIYAVRVC